MKLRPEQLESHLQKPLAPIYIVSGDEPFQVGEACQAIRSQARAQGVTEREVLHAQPVNVRVARRVAGNDDPIAGFQRIACHTLAGQLATYTFKQLRDYKDGSRQNRKMQEAVERLSDEQLAALAAWYARQPIPKVEVDEDETVSEDTLKLVFRGDKTRLIQPCASCHGARGEGAIIDVPSIAGQNVKYFVNTMRDYAKGERANDIYSRMRIIAKALTRDEINELAVYYARLGGQQGGGGLFQAFAN